MIKSLCIILLSFLISPDLESKKEVYITNNAKVRLYSEAPLENIEATSVKGFSVYNTQSADIQFSIPINSFKFKKSLMQEHFNENYMESDKYPFAKFKGKITQQIDPGKDGEYNVSATGELDVHGVKRQRTIKGSIRVAKGIITVNSKFDVLCKDHNIKIPQLVFQNIAESIQLTVSAIYNPYTASK